MSNIPSDINAVQSAVASPSSKNSDDKELSWSNVEDTEDLSLLQGMEEPLATVEPVVEVEPLASVEPAATVEPLAEVEPAATVSPTIDTLDSNESSDDDMPPLESDDEMPPLVESSDESDESDDDMPELVSDDDDILHMMVRDSGCPVCRGAIQTLLNHEHNELDEFTPLQRKHEVPSMITYTLWLFILLHAFNLVSTYCSVRPSC
jgi:hypothetical protein